MSKFIITNKKLLKNEVFEVETPEEALALISEKTLQIKEVYANGEAIVYKDDIKEMIAHKQVCIEIEEEKKQKEKEEKAAKKSK